MVTVKGSIQCYRCDAKIEIDLEVESLTIGTARSNSSGLVIKEPGSEYEGWARIEEDSYYGAETSHWYCPKHWRATKSWPNKEAVY